MSIPFNGCDKNCPYCVSRMTGYLKTDEKLLERDLAKVKKLSEMCDISSVLVTGKGDPLLNI